MQFISILGMLTLLGIAWALSYHRSEVRLRPVFWGLGLQFVFALIILRKDEWSFVGMALLGILLVFYILKELDAAKVAGFLVAAALTGFLVARFLPGVMTPTLVLLVVFLVVNARFELAPRVQRFAGSCFVVIGVAWLVEGGVYGEALFDGLSKKVSAFLNLSDYGAKFLFGTLSDPQFADPIAATNWPGLGSLFAFRVLPTIVFFGGFMSVLYYLGIIQKVVQAISRFMRWTIGTSGAETLSCSANVFVGQTEAPLLIKPFLSGMTKSEILTVMVGGFATIAGGVLVAYISFGIPAGHLIAASVMSAPAALVIGKIIYPEKEESQTAGDVEMPDIEAGGNVIEAAANGITDGLKLAVNVGAMLIGFIALVAVIDVILNWLDLLIDGNLLEGAYVTYGSGGLSPVVGEYVGYFPGSLQTLFGTVLRPLAWVMGVPWGEAAQVGNLLGIKLSLNELVAYTQLGTYMQQEALSERAQIIATYALCGFANFSSIGIQIGGISAVAPQRKADLARVGLKAMLGGALASWLTATIAGMLKV